MRDDVKESVLDVRISLEREKPLSREALPKTVTRIVGTEGYPYQINFGEKLQFSDGSEKESV